jgi:uncharacterized protein (DUF433 family)
VQVKKQIAASGQPKQLGQYIVADPKICHGKPTFRGTRIMVDDVLEMVAKGMPWDKIVYQWYGRISHEAIAEAIQLAREVFRLHTQPKVQRKGS